MELKIWKHFIEILTYRNNLTDTIKPFMQNLKTGNEIYNISDKKYFSFIKNLSSYQIELLLKSKIINEDYKSLLAKTDKVQTIKRGRSSEAKVKEIIHEDNYEALRRMILEKGIKAISPVSESFNENPEMTIPLIIYSIIYKAIRCFKYLLINGIENPKSFMCDKNPQIINNLILIDHFSGLKKYDYQKWDCMAVAIYYGEIEIITILEEKGIEKGYNPAHLEAAILSFRNSIAKSIINKIQSENNFPLIVDNVLNKGLFASVKNNNIQGGELLLNHGANINAEEN